MPTKTKKRRGEAPASGVLAAFRADLTLIRMLSALTGETHPEIISRLMREPLCRELRGKGQDPDRVIAEAASRN